MAEISSKDRDNLHNQQQPGRIATGLFWVALLTAFMGLTTNGFFDRITF